MADNQLPYGIRWVGSLQGTSGPKPQRVRLASGLDCEVGGTNVNIRPGDPVQQLASGYWGMAVGTEGTQSRIGGICAGFGPIFDGSAMSPTNRFVNASGVYGSNFERMSYMWVIPADGQVFEMCCNDKTTFTTEATYLAAIGANCDMILAADTTNPNDTKITSLINIGTNGTSSSLQWRLLDLSPRINEDYSGLYVQYKVTVNVTQTAPYYGTGL